MKTSMYFNYTSRSLLRGGQRTVLAVFCVAVGVVAIVALQLVGFMLQSSLTSNTRDVARELVPASTGYPSSLGSDASTSKPSLFRELCSSALGRSALGRLEG